MPHQNSEADPNFDHAIRTFKSGLPGSVLQSIQQGVLRTTYRGISFLKSPFDIAIYLQLIGKLQPRTVIEIGTKQGGSALWFADMLTLHKIESCVISVDIEPPTMLTDPRIRFLQGNALHLEEVLTDELLSQLPHPFLVIEDSAHFYEITLSTLNFFDSYLHVGDYMVVEDGIVDDFPDPHYALYQSGPNRAVAEFLRIKSARYKIDTALCDYFGYNYTYNPNGYLIRI